MRAEVYDSHGRFVEEKCLFDEPYEEQENILFDWFVFNFGDGYECVVYDSSSRSEDESVLHDWVNS
jgi:hypothetical protein